MTRNIATATAAAPASAATLSKSSGTLAPVLAAAGVIWSTGLGAPPAWPLSVGRTSGSDVDTVTEGLLGGAARDVGVGDLSSSDRVTAGGRVASPAVELVRVGSCLKAGVLVVGSLVEVGDPVLVVDVVGPPVVAVADDVDGWVVAVVVLVLLAVVVLAVVVGLVVLAVVVLAVVVLAVEVGLVVLVRVVHVRVVVVGGSDGPVGFVVVEAMPLVVDVDVVDVLVEPVGVEVSWAFG